MAEARALAAEQALEAEREACAKVAESTVNNERSDYGAGFDIACDAIASAIRSRSTSPSLAGQEGENGS
jgi:hypothetical protein